VKAIQVYKKLTPEIENKIDNILDNKPKGTLGFNFNVPTRRDKYV